MTSNTIAQDYFFEVMSDILQVLQSRGACWGKCLPCPNNTGVTREELLTIFSNVDQLNEILVLGLRLGTLKQNPVDTFFINANMLFENPINDRFKDVLPGLCEPKLVRLIGNIV